MASRLLSQMAVRTARPMMAASARLPVYACATARLSSNASGAEAANPTPAPIVEGVPNTNADSPLIGLTGGAPEEKIEFDTPNKWVNPLMGWTSARDTAAQLREMMYFVSEEEAIKFAQREGFQFTVMPFHSKTIKAKAFADNFKWKGAPKVTQQK